MNGEKIKQKPKLGNQMYCWLFYEIDLFSVKMFYNRLDVVFTTMWNVFIFWLIKILKISWTTLVEKLKVTVHDVSENKHTPDYSGFVQARNLWGVGVPWSSNFSEVSIGPT